MTTKLEMNYVPAIDYCEAVIDGTHDSPKQVEDGRKLVTSKNIVGGKLDLENCYNISEEDFEQINKRSKVYEWDILMSMIGTVGEICLLKDEPDYAIKNVGVFRARSESDAKWLYYYLTSPSAQFDIYSRLRGSTQKFLPLGELRNFPILKPENEEIKSKIINQLFSIDCLISCKERLNEKVSELISTLFRSWFINFDPVKAKSEGKLPYGMDEKTAALFPDTFKNTEYGSIPNGWSVTKVSELCKSVDYGFTANSTEDSSGQKFLRITDIIPKQINWNSVPYCQISDDLLSKYRIESGDIVIARTGAGVGVAKRIHNPPVDAVFASYLVRVKPKNTVLSIYLGTWLESEQYQYYIQGISYGAGQPQCSAKYLVTFDLVLPPIEILSAFNERIKSLLDLQKYTNYQMNCLAKTRDALLPKLMSGELSVS
jgi:type I restriction enzyme S subunit